MDIQPSVVEAYDRDAPGPEATETATVALGCFWGPDARFGALEGVVRTRVGYAGGSRPDPSYHALGDHTEALQIEYDPEVRPYRDLLERVFRSHDPTTQVRKTQYQNVVFTASQTQRETLEAVLEARELDPAAVETRLEELEQFHVAEDYHQKHSLRGSTGPEGVFEALGYDEADLRESPAAAKLNGHAAGHEVDGRLAAALERQAGPR
jgi:peptide-methionine (S)-S-oxide reductase